MNLENDPGPGKMGGWVMFFVLTSIFCCVEGGMVYMASENGNWITPLAIGGIGIILGYTAMHNLMSD